jgi:hypothetical protein
MQYTKVENQFVDLVIQMENDISKKISVLQGVRYGNND